MTVKPQTEFKKDPITLCTILTTLSIISLSSYYLVDCLKSFNAFDILFYNIFVNIKDSFFANKLSKAMKLQCTAITLSTNEANYLVFIIFMFLVINRLF